ncbi:MAG TPA: 30S ribosomal protein S18, partial [Candidatus Caccousia avicola]|nr:30S ribosomal protein S18 [Candidatus Caccousia avicola]
MAERNDRPERRSGGRKGRKKVCSFCVDKIETIDYKDVAKLRRFISER